MPATGTEFSLLLLRLVDLNKTVFMSTAVNNLPGGANQQQDKNSQEHVQISQPKVERAEGPFEHSGETSGWTEEEKVEVEEKEE
jgi:hypothetical protein